MDNIYEFINKNTFIQKLYDVIRIIEPVSNKEVMFTDGKEPIAKNCCYEFWKKSKRCSNCVTMRAYYDKKTYVKIEYNKDKIFLVTASPIRIGSEDYVIELLKDITETGIIENIEKRTQEGIVGAIQEMNNLVVKDGLTGVYNRRFINEQLPSALLANKLGSKPLTVMMIDIDHFKLINDEYGHLAGDAALIQISKLLQDSTEEEIGWAARYGGEEFFLLVYDKEPREAFEFAESLRKTIYENVFTYNEVKIKLSVSIGVYICEDVSLSPEEIIANADRKLYLAKEKGRNRIQC
ncbi:MAG: GGDEF domain-containing protein [Bacillota bacterium]|nr:GGDEF domain-containing protein [Bacillota bacterium]